MATKPHYKRMKRSLKIIFSAKQVEECRKQARFEKKEDGQVALQYVRKVIKPRGYSTYLKECRVCGGFHIVYEPIPHKIEKERRRLEKQKKFRNKK